MRSACLHQPDRQGIKIGVEVDNHDVMIRDRVAGQRFLKPAFEELYPRVLDYWDHPRGRKREFSMGIVKGLRKALQSC
jgi:hypothetical protein